MIITVDKLEDLKTINIDDLVLKTDLLKVFTFDDIINNSSSWKIYDNDYMIFIGNSKLNANEHQAIVGIFGDTLVAKRQGQFSAHFAYPLDTRNNSGSIVGSAVIDYNVNKLRVRTGTTPNSIGTVRSKRTLRYTAGRDAEMMFTAIFTAGVVGTEQRAGLFDDEDGFFIGFKDDKFSVFRRFDGDPDEVINQENFNGDKLDGTGSSKFVYDPTKINIFRIAYGYLGTAPILYQISVPNGKGDKWITFHKIDRRNIVTQTSIRIPFLPLCVEVLNGATNADIIVQSGSVYAGVFDGSADNDRTARYFAASSPIVAFSAATQEILVLFHNKETFHSIENHVEAKLLYFTGAVEGNKPVIIEILKLPNQTINTGTYVDVDSENSTFEYSMNETLDLTNAELLLSFAIGKSGSVFQVIKDLQVSLLPGEFAGIVVTTPSLSDVVASFRWKENF